MVSGKHIKKSTIVLLVVFLIIPVSIVVAQDTATQNYGAQEPPIIDVGKVLEVDSQRISTLSVEQAIELAYTIRNITYPLFEWEIGYNATAAKVQLGLGDRFLERAINLSVIAPRRAIVFAFVASLHYSHAPPIANQVLGIVTHSNLGENNEITEQTVIAVINTSNELRNILMSAVEYAKGTGYNTSSVEELIVRADKRLENATNTLEEGNITLAFRQGVSAYRMYVRAYALLVFTVRAEFLRSRANMTASEILRPREGALGKVIENLPLEIRTRLRTTAEIRNMRELVLALRQEGSAFREQIQIREKECLKEMIRNLIRNANQERYGPVVNETEFMNLIEDLYNMGIRGPELARRVLLELELRLRERSISERFIKIIIPRR